MRKALLYFIAVIVITPSFSHASPSLDGGSGLTRMRTADVTESGSADISVFGAADIYDIPGSDELDVDSTVSLGLTVGIGDLFEIGVISPYLTATDSSVTGWRDLKGVAKLRILGGRDKGYGIAFSGFSTFDTSSAWKNVGSDKRNYGYEMNISIFGKGASFHLTGGFEKSDTKIVAPVPMYAAGEKIVGALGVELHPVPEFIFSFEALETHGVHVTDDNLLLIPGVKYSPNDYITYTIGASIGVPKDRSEPEYQYIVGMTLGLGKSENRVRTVSSRLESVEDRIKDVEGRLAQAGSKVETGPAEINERVAEPTGASAAELERTLEDITRIESRQEELRTEILNLEARLASLETTGARPVRKESVQQVSREEITGLTVEAPSTFDAAIEVLNGARIARLAARTADRLREKGFSVADIGNAPKVRDGKTRIFYKEGLSDEAIKVGHALPGDQLVLKKSDLPDDIDIRVVLGSDY